jgi:hypothetical protein
MSWSSVGGLRLDCWRGVVFWREGGIPKAVLCVALACDDDFAMFQNFDVVFDEEYDAFVVAELAELK